MTSEPQHSSFIGGSNAAARIACPASYQMEQRLPKSAIRETSDYADEGSALHAAMALILNENYDAEHVLGMTFAPYDDYPMTRELVNEALAPCVEFFEALDDEVGGMEYRIECRVSVSSIPGVFGTTDILGRAARCSILGDWKFGIGEKVLAWYEDDDGGVVPNEQPMLYTLAATETHPEMFEVDDPDWPIEIFIAQPRHRDGPNFDRITVTMRDVMKFRDQLEKAAKLAKSEAPPMAKGSWCRFMACKSICPLHTGPLLDASALGELLARAQLEAAVGGSEAGAVAAVDWDRTYGLMLDLAARIEPVIREWRAHAQAYLEEGNTVAGWKLVGKRAQRKWVKPDKSVERKLARLGLSKDERMPRTLLSAPQAEKALKKHGKDLPDGYYDAISSGLTLASAADPRQSIEPVTDVIASLTTALAAISQQDPEEKVKQS